MLAFGMNGELPVEHGFPVRMLIPRLYGYVSACKWLTRIEATRVRRLRRLLDRARLGRGRPDQGRLPDRHARPAARVPGGPPRHRRGRLGTDPGDRLDPEVGSTRRTGSRPSSPRRSTPTCGASRCALRLPRAPLDHRPRHQRRRRGAGRGADPPFPSGSTGWHSIQVVAAVTTRSGLPAGLRLVPAPPVARLQTAAAGAPPRPATMRSHGQDKGHHLREEQPPHRGVLITAVSTLAITLSACGSDDTASSASAEGSPAAAPWRPAGPVPRRCRTKPFGAGCSAVPAEGEGSFTGMTDMTSRHRRQQQPGAVHPGRRRDRRQPGRHAEHHRRHHRAGPGQPGVRGGPAGGAERAAGRHRGAHHGADPPRDPGPAHAGGAGRHHTTLNNDEVVIEGEGENFTIAMDGTVVGMEASVICGNVQTANATVYIIDQVLKPAAM